MKLSFLGAAHEVTGSSTLLEARGMKILIDCGLEQGPDIYENCDIPINPSDIDFVLLTHAHIDHSGKIPYLVANGFKGSVYSTDATKKLCRIMLLDSAHIQELEAEWRNRKATRSGDKPYSPLYTTTDVERTIPLFKTSGYNTPVEIAEGIAVRFIDAGHLIGSASIEVTVSEEGKDTVLLFSGDVGNINIPLIRNPQKPERADFVVIESTYGNRLHGERPDYVAQFSSIIQSTFDRGGNVVIPAFAVGRTQEMLYLIRIIKERGLVRGHGEFPVWLDSPLAIDATSIYSGDITEYFDNETRRLLAEGIDPIKFNGLNLALTSDESKQINFDTTPKIIISASGMCEAGRIRHHLKHNLWREDSTILFVGYQAEGSLGRIILEGAKTVKIFGESISVKARIEKLEGVSGHADRKNLLEWLGNIKTPPVKVFVNHGGDTVCDEFAETIKETLGFSATAPYNGAEYDLKAGKTITLGNTIRLKQKNETTRAITVFNRLTEAGRRLMSVIDKNRGGTNKDLARFASQITALADKWDR